MGASLLLAISCLGFLSHDKTFDLYGEGEEVVNCDEYFDPVNDYTSLYEIVDNLNSGIINATYKTWGTVTKYYLDSSNNKNFYVQSTDQNGEVAGMMVYRSSAVVAEGSVLTIEGIASLYNNLPQFNNPTLIVDYVTNSSPVTNFLTSESF